MMFTEDTVDDGFADHPDGGDKLLADRVFLLDPEVAEPMVAGISFADVSRVGIPAYLAELQIDLHTVEAADSFFAEDGAESRNFAIAEDRSHIDRALRAVNAAKAARDTVLISFAPKRLAQMGDNLSAATTYDDWVAEVL
jgi:hypothetical protein